MSIDRESFEQYFALVCCGQSNGVTFLRCGDFHPIVKKECYSTKVP